MPTATFTRLPLCLAAFALAMGSAGASPLKDGAPGSSPAVEREALHATYDRTAGAVALRAALLDGATESFIASSDREAIIAFYRDRGFGFAWIEDGRLSEPARLVMERIRQAGSDGLDPAAYRLPWQSIGLRTEAKPGELAATELMLSQAVADYARHIYSGRIDPTSLSANIDYPIRRLDPADILALVAGSRDPVAVLEAYQPPHPEYHALRAELARERGGGAGETNPPISDGPLIKAGMSDGRVVTIRERLGLPVDVVDPTVYDEAVVAAVRDFQRSSRLAADGIVGRNTIAAFNRGPVDKVSMIIANMERWRWMPRHLGNFYVRVNVPDYHLDIYKGAEVVHTTRIVVGTVSNQTPMFSDEIEHIVVNPVWNVPASIARNEMLPRLRSGSGLAGYTVYASVGGKFRAVSPGSINWRTVNMSKIQIKQPPGSRNALGQVKFLFPNKYSVYLHDTPSKSLFERETRAFSHGCIRVKDPWEFADALVAHHEEVDGAKLRKMVGGGERWVNLKQRIPVHITYFTAWVDGAGRLQVRDDVYGHDKRLIQALASG